MTDFSMSDVASWAGGQPVAVAAPAAPAPEAEEAEGEVEAEGTAGLLHGVVADLQAMSGQLASADVTDEPKPLVKKLKKFKDALDAMAEDAQELAEEYEKAHEGDEEEEEERVTLGGDED